MAYLYELEKEKKGIVEGIEQDILIKYVNPLEDNLLTLKSFLDLSKTKDLGENKYWENISSSLRKLKPTLEKLEIALYKVDDEKLKKSISYLKDPDGIFSDLEIDIESEKAATLYGILGAILGASCGILSGGIMTYLAPRNELGIAGMFLLLSFAFGWAGGSMGIAFGPETTRDKLKKSRNKRYHNIMNELDEMIKHLRKNYLLK